MACAEVSWLEKGVQAEPQINLKVLLDFLEFVTAAMSDIKSDKLKICNFISSSGISAFTNNHRKVSGIFPKYAMITSKYDSPTRPAAVSLQFSDPL
jgi:hypothetical protein